MKKTHYNNEIFFCKYKHVSGVFCHIKFIAPYLNVNDQTEIQLVKENERIPDVSSTEGSFSQAFSTESSTNVSNEMAEIVKNNNSDIVGKINNNVEPTIKKELPKTNEIIQKLLLVFSGTIMVGIALYLIKKNR